MAAIDQMIVTLRPDLAKIVRDRVSAGEFASAGEFVDAAVELKIIDDIFPISDTDLDPGIVLESSRRYDAMIADPTQCMTHEEFWASMESEEEPAELVAREKAK